MIYGAGSGQVPSQTGYDYDGDQRVTRQISYNMASETWETDSAYQGGDATTVTYQNLQSGKPDGGTPQTTFTNGEGRTSAIYQYHSEADAAIGPSAPAADYDKTTYAYTPAQELATVTDAAGSTWAYGYDLAGDQTTQSDPDSGASASLYDPAGQLTSVTDARNDQISYVYDADGRKTAEYDTTGGASETSSDELASWVYDTLSKGKLTSSTSYYNGSAYTESVVGYGTYGLPTGTRTIIPSAQGALAGTYTTGDTYDPDTRQPTSVYQSAAGGLPAETSGWGYDTAGDPVSLASSLWTYAPTVSYTEYGQPLQYDLGPSTDPVYVTDAYDQQTQNLTGQQVAIGSTTAVAGAYAYAYDNAGDVLSDTDTPSAGSAQDQCFQYDYLGRLSQAWSQGSSSCTAGPSQSAESGAAAPYWEKYSYNDQNDMTSDVSTPAAGAATTTTSAYPPAGAAQPHAVASQTASGPGGTATTGYGYNADGDLTSVSGAQTAVADLGRRRAAVAAQRQRGHHRLHLRRRREPAHPPGPRLDHALHARRGDHPHRHHPVRDPVLHHRRSDRRRPQLLRAGRLPRRGPAGHIDPRRQRHHHGGHQPVLRPLRQPRRHPRDRLAGPAGIPERRRRYRHRPDQPRRPPVRLRHRIVRQPRPPAQPERPARPQPLRLRGRLSTQQRGPVWGDANRRGRRPAQPVWRRRVVQLQP